MSSQSFPDPEPRKEVPKSSQASAPRPPRIPNLNLELPDVQKASRPSHNKMRPVNSSKAPISETDKCVPCIQRPIPMFYFNPESAPGGDDGLAKLYKPHSMKSPHAEHATKSIPSSQEHTIKLFGKSITNTITCSAEEATTKHHSGKEPVPSHGIRIDEVVRIKDAVMDSHWASIRKNRWIRNEARIEKRNTDVVRKIMMSGSEEEESQRGAGSQCCSCGDGAPPCQTTKMSDYSVWD